VRTPRARPPDTLCNDEKPLEAQGGEAARRHGESLAFFQGSLLTLLPTRVSSMRDSSGK
jgi:hypothetical protein